jgi:hypothetical protein
MRLLPLANVMPSEASVEISPPVGEKALQFFLEELVNQIQHTNYFNSGRIFAPDLRQSQKEGAHESELAVKDAKKLRHQFKGFKCVATNKEIGWSRRSEPIG